MNKMSALPKKGKFTKAENAFTLAEVLITLAIIGVVAAITIPSVVVNTNQMEFKTGLRKAVSVLNQAITLNKALTGESPYDNGDLYNYLQQNMSVMRNKVQINGYDDTVTIMMYNSVFYTTDGMRYEIPGDGNKLKLHESDYYLKYDKGNCGSYGLTAHNPDNTTETPCLILVDVNGDRKPTYAFYNKDRNVSTSSDGWQYYHYSPGIIVTVDYPQPTDRLLKDVFPIMITDQGAIPYGVVAQKAMYQAQK